MPRRDKGTFKALKAPKYINPDKMKANQIFKGLNEILIPKANKNTKGKMAKANSHKILSIGEMDILNKLDKCDELVEEDKRELCESAN